MLDLFQRMGTGMLQVSAAVNQHGESASSKARREAIVTFLILSPAIIGLAATMLPPKRR